MKGGLTDYLNDKCLRLVDKLIQLPVSRPFISKVDPMKDGVHDYFDVIKTPMSLDVIHAKLQAHEYVELDELVQDVELIWQNARIYNGEDSEVYLMAREAAAYFNRRVWLLPSSAEEEWLLRLLRITRKLNEAFARAPKNLNTAPV